LGCCGLCGHCASTCAAGALVSGSRGDLAETCLVGGALQVGDEFVPRGLENGQTCEQRCDFVFYFDEARLVGFAQHGSALARALGVQLGVDLLELPPHRIA